MLFGVQDDVINYCLFLFKKQPKKQITKDPKPPVVTEISLHSYGSTHSDLSDGVPLWDSAPISPWTADAMY